MEVKTAVILVEVEFRQVGGEGETCVASGQVSVKDKLAKTFLDDSLRKELDGLITVIKNQILEEFYSKTDGEWVKISETISITKHYE